jgi:hypothetical protein
MSICPDPDGGLLFANWRQTDVKDLNFELFLKHRRWNVSHADVYDVLEI